MVKLFAPWVSWKVLPYSGRIALQFVLHTVAFLIITRITVCWRCFFSSRQRNGRKYFLSLGTFYGDVSVISFAAGGGLGAVLGTLYYSGLCLGFYSMRIALENEIGFEITGITKLFHVPSPQPLIIS